MQEEGQGKTTVVPCGDPAGLVEALKKNILERFCKADAPSDNYRLSLAGCTEAAVSDGDVVQEVLRDGDCLLLKRECDE